jgi:hypothetical protein
MLEYTEPHKFLYSEETNYLYIMDDYGNAIQIHARMWYAPFYWEI